MRTRQILLTLAGLFTATALFSQSAPYTDMARYDSSYDDTVTANVAVPYFVMPDPVLNDGFNAQYDETADRTTNNLESTWTWSLSAGATAAASGSPTGDDQDPYTERTWSFNAGTVDTLKVIENSAYGSCTGNEKAIPVVVVPEPVFEVNNGTDDTLYYCDGDVDDIVLADITDNGVSGGNFKINYDYKIDSLSSDLSSSLGTIESMNDTVLSIPEAYGADVPIYTGVNFAAVDGKITEWVLAFDNSLDATNENGLTDHISRKSQYLTADGTNDQDYDYYAPSATGSPDVIVIRVFPLPETGDIYFIPNDFNQ